MIVAPPMASRDALEKASAILRKGKCMPFDQARQKALDHRVLTMLLRYDPDSGLFTRLVRRCKFQVGEIAGNMTRSGYVEIEISQRRYKAHRLAWFYMTKEWPELLVDHANGIPSDNRWQNLRLATPSQNQQNKKMQTNNESALKGVSFDKRRNVFYSSICFLGSRIYIGTFATAYEAHAAYVKKATELCGEFARSA